MQHSFATVSEASAYAQRALVKIQAPEETEKIDRCLDYSLTREEQRICDMATD